MKKSYMIFLAIIIILFLGSPVIFANSEFTDPHEKFSLLIPDGWIYHAFESTNNLLVFYGPSDEQVLYIERFPDAANHNPESFALRVIELYSKPYGLKDFALITEPQIQEVDQQELVGIVYSYTGTKPRIEHRLFAVTQNTGLTITYSDSAVDYHNNAPEFESLLQGWIWLEGAKL